MARINDRFPPKSSLMIIYLINPRLQVDGQFLTVLCCLTKGIDSQIISSKVFPSNLLHDKFFLIETTG
jgi:hypothetical protein